MNWLDIVIIIAMIISIFIGLMLGFIRMVISLAGIIVGVILASHFYRQLAGVLTFVSNPNIANVVAFIIILVGVMLLALIAASLLRAILKKATLSWLDRVGGATLGFVTAAILISAILASIAKFFGQGPVTESLLAGILLNKFPIILGLLPAEFNAIRNFFH